MSEVKSVSTKNGNNISKKKGASSKTKGAVSSQQTWKMQPSKKMYFQVVWSGDETSSPSLVLMSDLKTYVFNCGEGLQRVFTQSGIRKGKFGSFFLTQYKWSHIGGLFGLGMSLRDMHTDAAGLNKKSAENKVASNGEAVATNNGSCKNPVSSENGTASPDEPEKGIENYRVYAPRKMSHIFEASKSFLRYHESDRELEVFDQLDIFNDFQVRIIPMSIQPKPVDSRNPIIKKTDKVIDVDVCPRYKPPAMCYACHFHPLPGKFDAKKASELGIPNGPLRRVLVQGDTIQLPDGRMIRPEEVVSSSLPGSLVLIVDCPSILYVQSLQENPTMQRYLLEPNAINLVIHFTLRDVCEDAGYVAWTNKFPSSTKHVYIDGLRQDNVPYESQHCLQTVLNSVDPKFFPLIDIGKCSSNQNSSGLRNFSKINVRELLNEPSSFIDHTESGPQIDRSKLPDVIAKVSNDSNISADTEMNVNGKRSNDGLECPQASKRTKSENDLTITKYPHVVCLGTGASLPAKYRNVSGTLLFLQEDTAVLLDCGEGTYGELVRHYGEQADSVLHKVKFVFISHMHPDHHLGLITLMTKAAEVRSETDDTLLVMSPYPLFVWLKEFAKISQNLKFRFCECASAYSGCEFFDGIQVQAVQVNHPGIAHGLVIKCPNDGPKVTYSGDTMPCDALIAAGMNSTLLIHEATLEDDMIEDALRKKHSTTSQALDVATRMNAQWVLLTHISQRYPKVPIVKENNLSLRTAYAFDHMELGVEDIPRFHTLVPMLNEIPDVFCKDFFKS